MTNISDVARVAGVSVATVSRALRGIDTVQDSTRQRVLEAATQLDYVVSPSAASLASGRTRVVGIITPFLTRWFFANALSAIEKTLREYGFHALLIDLEADGTFDRRELTKQMLSKRVDGLIAVNIPLREEERQLIDRLGLALVAIGNPVDGHPLVRIDEDVTVSSAVDHVVSLGHQRIGYVGAVPASAEHTLVPYSRLSAFRNALERHTLSVPDAWVIECDWTASDAETQARNLFARPGGPTAIIAGSDEMAFGVMSAATEADLRIPEDLSVIGIDDHYLSEVLKVSTVRQDVIAQGSAAAEILLHQMLKGSEEIYPSLPLNMGMDHTLTVPTEVIVRKTTARLRDTVDEHSFLGLPH